MLTFTEKTMRQDKGTLTNCPTIKKVVFGTRNNYNLASLHVSNVLFVCKKFFSVKLIDLFDQN